MDEGGSITVLETEAHGDRYGGHVKGITTTNRKFPMGDPRRYTRVDDGRRVGGLVWTRERWGGVRYEIRMKNLPLPGGCSCIWNYHEAPGDYTEIDIEMPANGKADGPDWARWAGLNTYYPDSDHINERKMDLQSPQNDGRFHVYRWDWYDGSSGSPRVEFYLDGRFLHRATENVPRSPAQLWIGNWPAVWSGDFNYDTQHLYVDWVKITELRDEGVQPPKQPRAGPRTKDEKP
jgi:beta-glucanase (GH16 family)